MTRVIMHGCNGKMGRVVCEQALVNNEIQVVAGVDVNVGPATFPTFERIIDCDMPADVIVDFSTAQAVSGLLEYVLEKKVPLVVCTTGLDEETLRRIDTVSKTVPVFLSANMSLGINLLVALAKKTAAILGDSGFDIEIIDRHHNQKIDAPSGTAIMIGNAINEQSGGAYHPVFDRSKSTKKRDSKEIGYHAVRGGTIVGDHTVIFAGKDEVIELSHQAASKDVFAVGAIKAAKFLVGKEPGKYNMTDIIGSI